MKTFSRFIAWSVGLFSVAMSSLAMAQEPSPTPSPTPNPIPAINVSVMPDSTPDGGWMMNGSMMTYILIGIGILVVIAIVFSAVGRSNHHD